MSKNKTAVDNVTGEKFILDADTLKEFDSFEVRRNAIEKRAKDLISIAMSMREEEMDKLSEERTALWNSAVYERFNLDTDLSWAINRETGEVRVTSSEEDEDDNSEDHDCGDPECVPCGLKRSLGGIAERLVRGIRASREGDSEAGVKTPFGMVNLPKSGKVTVH